MANAHDFPFFGDKHILVIGDLMLDKYLYGRVDRISPEAPVPLLLLDHAEYRLGGSGNVALNLSNLGARVSLHAVTGADEQSSLLIARMQEKGILHHGIHPLKSYQTTVKTRLIGGTQHLLRVDEEQIRELEEIETEQFLSVIEREIAQGDVDGIIMQDYNKGLLSAGIIAAVLSLAKDGGIPVAVDPKFLNFYNYRGAALFKPNFRELRAALPFEVEAETESLKRATAYLREEIGGSLYAITLSEKGIFLDDGTNALVIPTVKRNVVDVCGAGDAVVSAIFLAMLAGSSLDVMGRMANLAGGQVCEKVGVAPVELKKLHEEFLQFGRH